MLSQCKLASKLRCIASPSCPIFHHSAIRKLVLCRHGNATRGTISRHLHNTSRLYSSGSLFNISGLSHSRESGFLSKERGIPRTEFAPYLELIRLSEVEPFAEKKKLPTIDPSRPSLASSQELIQQSDGSGISVAYLIKEVESKRIANEEAERANSELRHKTKVLEGKLQEIWDRLAALSIVATVASILGLYYRRELYDLFLRYSPNAGGPQIASNPFPDLETVEKNVNLPATLLEEASPPIRDQDVHHPSFWRRMFWAY